MLGDTVSAAGAGGKRHAEGCKMVVTADKPGMGLISRADSGLKLPLCGFPLTEEMS